jgi:sigma-B regulation protein RsbU (phosphoserine phosphatase)
LILYSDGVTECQNPEGGMSGDIQLRAAIEAKTGAGPKMTDILGANLREWRGQSDFEDDISVLVLERPLASRDEPSLGTLPGENR